MLTFERPSVVVPCDCETECGWVHREYAGPSRFFLDGQEITEAEARAVY